MSYKNYIIITLVILSLFLLGKIVYLQHYTYITTTNSNKLLVYTAHKDSDGFFILSIKDPNGQIDNMYIRETGALYYNKAEIYETPEDLYCYFIKSKETNKLVPIFIDEEVVLHIFNNL